MPDFEDLISQLSAVRIGQDDKGRTANVAGHLLHSFFKEKWHFVPENVKKKLISKTEKRLLERYTYYMKIHQMRTKEAAREAIEEVTSDLKQEIK